MADITGLTLDNAIPLCLNVTGGVSASPVQITDGDNTASALYLSTVLVGAGIDPDTADGADAFAVKGITALVASAADAECGIGWETGGSPSRRWAFTKRDDDTYPDLLLKSYNSADDERDLVMSLNHHTGNIGIGKESSSDFKFDIGGDGPNILRVKNMTQGDAYSVVGGVAAYTPAATTFTVTLDEGWLFCLVAENGVVGKHAIFLVYCDSAGDTTVSNIAAAGGVSVAGQIAGTNIITVTTATNNDHNFYLMAGTGRIA